LKQIIQAPYCTIQAFKHHTIPFKQSKYSRLTWRETASKENTTLEGGREEGRPESEVERRRSGWKARQEGGARVAEDGGNKELGF
jgi:hypothetical protein